MNKAKHKKIIIRGVPNRPETLEILERKGKKKVGKMTRTPKYKKPKQG